VWLLYEPTIRWKYFLHNTLRFIVTANVVHTSPIVITMMMEAVSSSERTVFIRVPQRNIPEDGILHSHRRERLKSYIALTGWTL
jgi:hypothetical protein